MNFLIPHGSSESYTLREKHKRVLRRYVPRIYQRRQKQRRNTQAWVDLVDALFDALQGCCIGFQHKRLDSSKMFCLPICYSSPGCVDFHFIRRIHEAEMNKIMATLAQQVPRATLSLRDEQPRGVNVVTLIEVDDA